MNRTENETDVSHIAKLHLHLRCFVPTSVVRVFREVREATSVCGRAGGIQGFCWEKHDGCRERVVGGKQSRGSVCLGFLSGDSSSQSLSNGNQLTTNKAIARLGYLLLLWTFRGRGFCLLCFILPSPSKEGKRNVYTGLSLLWVQRTLSSFPMSFPRVRDLLILHKMKADKSPLISTLCYTLWVLRLFG